VFRLVIKRILYSIPVVIASSAVVFIVVHKVVSPTAYLALNPRASAADRVRLDRVLGLDKPLPQQYVIWLLHFLEGNWGTSLLSGQPVAPGIGKALLNSLILGFAGISIALLIGILVGAYSALHQYSPFDHAATGAAFVLLSTPIAFLALLLQLIFGVVLVQHFNLSEPWLYISGMSSQGSSSFSLIDFLRHLALPACVVAAQIIGVYSRYTRASMLDVLRSDYVRTARAKGLGRGRIITRHAFRNSMVPLTTQLALDAGVVVGGLIVTEVIFQWPGMGLYFINAMNNGDYPQILAWLMVTVTGVILFNLLADILYGVLDPRVRHA
jgi:peptide/nickel transport system permease protein